MAEKRKFIRLCLVARCVILKAREGSTSGLLTYVLTPTKQFSTACRVCPTARALPACTESKSNHKLVCMECPNTSLLPTRRTMLLRKNQQRTSSQLQ
eukprot:6208642-Pleurochrysis_carterae.AAC.2